MTTRQSINKASSCHWLLAVILLLGSPVLWAADTDGDNLDDSSDPLPNDAVNLNIFNGVVAAEKVGTAVAFVGDVNSDGYGDYVIGTPSYDLPAAPPAKAVKDVGKVEVISGGDGSTIFSMVGYTAGDMLGYAVASNAGDLTGDGSGIDIVVSAPQMYNAEYNVPRAGAVFVLHGDDHGAFFASDLAFGVESGAMFGAALALGDVDHDGMADVVVGAPKADDLLYKRADAGKVSALSTVIYGQELFSVYGTTAKAYAGSSVAVSDGYVIVGAPKDDDVINKKIDSGSVKQYRYNSSLGAHMSAMTYGESARDNLGTSLASGVFYGQNVVLIGAPGFDDVGFGTKKQNVGRLYFMESGTNTLNSIKTGDEHNAQMGSSLAVGDVNADGQDDFIIGIPKGDSPTTPKITKDTGSVMIVNGSTYNVINTIYGDTKGDLLGAAISVGDINNDGKADIIVGMPGRDVMNTKMQKDAGGVKAINATSL
jgi:hypothetical protein